MKKRRTYQRGEEAQTDSGMEIEMEEQRAAVVGYSVLRYTLSLCWGILGIAAGGVI
jgi:hypothetical protein